MSVTRTHVTKTKHAFSPWSLASRAVRSHLRRRAQHQRARVPRRPGRPRARTHTGEPDRRARSMCRLHGTGGPSCGPESCVGSRTPLYPLFLLSTRPSSALISFFLPLLFLSSSPFHPSPPFSFLRLCWLSFFCHARSIFVLVYCPFLANFTGA